MELRPRTAGDLPALELLARAVRASDGYPVYVPDDELVGFLASHDAIGAWVAADADGLWGQVALHPCTRPDVADVVGRPVAELAVVARLLVSPARRREGLGRALLERAWREAADRGRWAVLDVVPEHRAAVLLYRHLNWQRAGEVSLVLPDGRRLVEDVYAAPALRP